MERMKTNDVGHLDARGTGTAVVKWTTCDGRCRRRTRGSDALGPRFNPAGPVLGVMYYLRGTPVMFDCVDCSSLLDGTQLDIC
jgi:hypothetical protein